MESVRNVSTWDREHLWRFRAEWLRDDYMDGDTFTALCDCGYRGRHEARIRLLGYNAPERYAPGGAEATVRLREALLHCDPDRYWPLRIESVQRETVVGETTTFERYVSMVWVVDIFGEMTDVRSFLP